MDNDQEEPPPIVLDEHDAAAVAALLIRVVRLDEELNRDNELVAEASARVAANNVARGKTVTAFGVFGFDTAGQLWAQVLRAMGKEAYIRAIAVGKGNEIPKLLEKMGGEGATQSAEEGHAPRRPAPRIRVAILEHLRSLGEAGAVVGEIRRHLADAYGINVHEKTPGMTLYRLLKEGLVRREGRTWYAKDSDGNKENGALNGQPASAPDAGEAGTSPVNDHEGESLRG